MESLSEYQSRLESLEVELNRETYRQYAGRPYDEATMERLAAEIQALAVEALATFPPTAFPRPLLYATLRSSRAADYTRLDNEIYRRRSEAVATEDAGEVVNLSNWRLFNRRYVREPQRRRRVFDALIERVAALTPLLAERFALSRAVLAPHAGPLPVYLEEEGVEAATLERLIERTAQAARPAFLDALDRFAADLLGTQAEHFDDYYVFTNVIYAPVDPVFAAVDFDRLLGGVARGLGFDLSAVHVDGEARPGKHASPVCFGVRIPGEVYMLYQRISPVADYTGYAHELGHALHFASVHPALEYADRYLIPAGIGEIFSTLFEALSTTPAFLVDEAGLPPAAVEELRRREQFMELFFLTFYGANAMFKVRYWADGLSMDDADRLYAALYRRYVGLDIDGRYWQTHHVLSLHDVYAPSYLLAKVRGAELRRALVQRFGDRWWRRPDAGAFLREELMGPGRTIPTGTFSRLDPGPYLSEAGLSA